MSNSGLVSYTRLSPNHSGRRRHAITRITPHYMAGNLSVESCGELFASPSRRASSNYAIGSDGRVALYVDEGNRAWTSGNADNDNRAVTIECANLADSSLTAACWNSLVALCADICRRNGIGRCTYTGDLGGTLTMHCWFQDTSCPGNWMKTQFNRLANEVSAQLTGSAAPTPATSRNNAQGGRLDVDGWGGYNTVLDWQTQCGTYADGVISGQWGGNRQYLPHMTAVEWGGQGSQLVIAVQGKVGAGVDGIWGRETSTRIQEWFIAHGFGCGGCGADGYFGHDSVCALQRSLNAKAWK